MFKRGRVWWAWRDGKRTSTGKTDKIAAELVVADWERRSVDPAYDAEAKTSVNQAGQNLLAELRQRKRSPRTLEFNRQKLGHIVRIFGHESPLSGITATAVDAYIKQRFDEGAKHLTVSHERDVLRQMLKVARRRGEFSRDPATVLPLVFGTGYVPRERWLPVEELAAVLSRLAPHRAAHVAFIVATSARLGEAERAQREDITEHQAFLRGSKTKGSRRPVPIVPIFAGLWKLVLRFGNPDYDLFDRWTQLHRDLKDACKRAGIAPCSPNDLRRTHAKWLRNYGVEPHLIAPMLGHTDTKMVERVYGRIDPGPLGKAITAQLGTVTDLYLPAGTERTKHQLAHSDHLQKPRNKQEKWAPPAEVESATNGLGNQWERPYLHGVSERRCDRKPYVRPALTRLGPITPAVVAAWKGVPHG